MVSLIKLKNGTEVVGYIKKIDEKIVIEEPMQINYKTVDYTSVPVISFSRYCPFSSEELFTFDKEFVLHLTPVKKALEEYYTQSIAYYKEVIDKHIDEELYSAVEERKKSSNSYMKDYLKKVKIDGYAQ